YTGGFSFQIGPHSGETFGTFVWNGFSWSAGEIASRLAWFLFAFLVLLLAAAFFDRFDPSRGVFRRFSLRRGLLSDGATTGREEGSADDRAEPASAAPAGHTHLTPLPARAGNGRFGAVLAAELRLMMKGRSKWWLLVALGLLIGSFAAPAGEARGKVLAFAWLWPVLVWSAMGTREPQNGTAPLIFSCAHALKRQLPALWLAGALVALVTSAGVGVRTIAAGDWAHAIAWIGGAMFIPALALALGVWSGTGKLFEGLYTAFWYAGPLQPTPALDFMGASPNLSGRIPAFYLAATLVLLCVAAVGRRRQIRG
ncbi:MAG TPA: hypothetical protein VEG63_13445, partial [Candidatus Acidoferrales bacterium]|nr:hypothetical protein [Candidatus Acidoferrales bacterium]